jgi:MFS superfamily sulfate permease-like transporter
MITAFLSIGFLIRRTATPAVAVLGRIGTTDRYTDIARHPDNLLIEGVLIFRIESSILYFNVEHILTQIKKQLAANEGKVKPAILTFCRTFVDVSGSKMILQLSNELKQKVLR